ncbi:hypothetical protein Cch01nite_15970 [Cellulomonas chitinilytica]|uniref:Uncharacterized protein n=1 Tax=Cellulomonas chitinilytica TaxID=398759 RepID=A0A919TZH6_9CELL|nr:hypothetical protein Cch01nite_15970 [Cellulomonas chitinilytica]
MSCELAHEAGLPDPSATPQHDGDAAVGSSAGAHDVELRAQLAQLPLSTDKHFSSDDYW